jgi:hypothetical protein
LATDKPVAIRQVVSKEQVAGCPTGWKESLHGKNWELMTLRFRSGQALVQGIEYVLRQAARCHQESRVSEIPQARFFLCGGV